MDSVRLGLIGCGGIARMHTGYFDQVHGLDFVAASDLSETNLKTIGDKFGVKTFADGHELIGSGLVDAILIATPHYFHPEYAIAGFDAGLHVLVEKPVAVTAKAAAEVNQAYEQARKKNSKLLYAAMFNQRCRPLWMAVKKLIDNGKIGQLMRASWTMTGWFRSQSYYDSATWRATWKGEGGGVLLNQCPHNLDLFQWFVGLPESLIATADLGKRHDIEVEDEVSALLRFPGGATGTFTTSTGQSPGINRLEIVGDRGTLIADNERDLTFFENATPITEFTRNTTQKFDGPPFTRFDITPSKSAVPEHQAVTTNFINAILHGEPLIAPATEGVNSLELANGMLLSGLSDSRRITLPTDHDAFDAKLKKLIDDAEAAAV